MTTDQTSTTEGPAPDEQPPAETEEPAATESTAEDTATEPNREAANYRRRLRATETERDGLQERVTGLQRAAAERLATGRNGLVDGADLWRYGTELADLLDDAGQVDADKVTAKVSELLAERRHLAAPRAPKADPSQGGGGQTVDTANSWAALLSRGKR